MVGRPRVSAAPRIVGAFVLVAFTVAAIVVASAQTGLWNPSPAGEVPAAASSPTAAPAAAPGLTPSAPSSPTPPPVPAALALVTHPEGAAVMITTGAGTSVSGQTPFETMVETGPVEVTVELDGFNRITEDIVVEKDTALDWWLDPAGLLHRKVAEFSTGAAPKQVAFSPDGGQLWSSLLGGTGVDVFDPLSGERLGQVDLGDHGAVEVIFSADGSTAYASQMESASVFEIDVATLSVRRQMPTGGAWSKVMALSPDESTLYVSNWSSNDVSEIDLASGEVRRVLPTVATPRGLYPTDDGRLFVAGYDAGEIARIDLADGSSDTLLRTGGAMRHLVGDAASGMVYANDMATDEAYAVDLATEEVRKLADTNEKPNTTDLTPDGRILYVANRGENNPESYYLPGPEWGSVIAIDTHTGGRLDGIVGGNQTTGLDVSPDGRFLAFSDFLDDRIQVYEIPATEDLVDGGGGRAAAHLAELAK